MAAQALAVGRSVRLFLFDGISNGLVIGEIGNWSGKALAAPRTRLAGLLRREEANRTGVYILVGRDPDRPLGRKAYVGETDNVRQRLPRHDNEDDMEFFDHVIFVVSKDDNLTKAHVRFLESQLIKLLKSVGGIQLINGTNPDTTKLPEADRLDMMVFLEQFATILPVLGFDLLHDLAVVASTGEGASPTFEFAGLGAQATARETDEAFVVLKNSTARKEGTATFPAGYRTLRDQLVADGSLVEDHDASRYRFTADVAFSSPSAAASVVAARSASGPREWRLQETDKTYKEWRATLFSDRGEGGPL